ncbi:hypothetical protein ES703_59128 [subsurface metagenome]
MIWGDKDCEHQWDMQKISLLHENRNFQQGTQEEVLATGHELRHTHKTSNLRAGFCSLCNAWRGAFGLEPTPELYISHTIEILREIRRVLRKDGVVFWNIGDSYSPSSTHRANVERGGLNQLARNVRNDMKFDQGILKPKDLCLIPFRVAIAAQEDGWWVRSVIIWSKPNPMPESVTDRPTESHEYILMLTKSGTIQYWTHPRKRGSRTKPKPDYIWTHKRTRLVVDYQPVSDRILKELWTRSNLWRGHDYYWDADAVREQYTEPMNRWGGETLKRDTSKTAAYKEMQNIGYSSAFRVGRPMRPNPSGRNIRSVWTFPTTPFPAAHFAVFPEKLPEICIKAATPEVGCCSKCGAPWERITEYGERIETGGKRKKATPNIGDTDINTGYRPTHTLGWQPTCKCNADKVPSIVLDPFAGACTTLYVAKKLNRYAAGYDTSAEYCHLGADRCRQQVLL